MGMLRTKLNKEQLVKWFEDCKLDKKSCPFFMTQGFECPNKMQNCEHGKHQFKWDKIQETDAKKILEKSLTTKKVWFDKSTFERHGVQLESKYKSLLGDANGPKST
jgi:hypothetical protein